MSALCWMLLWSAQVPEERLSDWKQEKVIRISQDLHHVQGIDVEGGTLWVSAVDRKQRKGFLYKVKLESGQVQQSVELQQGEMIHPGGLQIEGDSLWIPVAEYDRDGPSRIEKRNKNSLVLESFFEVPDHIGCVAVFADKIIGGSWGSRTIYTWARDGKLLDKRANPYKTEWQDLKGLGTRMIASGNLSREEGAIEWIRPSDFALQRRVVTGKTDRGVLFTNEGVAWRGKSLYLLPEDFPSRLFIFREKAR